MGDNLHYYLSDTNTVLATRTQGKQVAEHLHYLATFDPPRVIVDFSGVNAVGATFIGELLKGLEELFPDRYELANVNEDDAEVIAFVRERQPRQ